MEVFFVFLAKMAINNSFILVNTARKDEGLRKLTYYEYMIGLVKVFAITYENLQKLWKLITKQ